jgi:rhodanese-related sulfurtransferase
MRRWLETVAWLVVLMALSTLVIGEGRKRARLEARVALTPAELYRTLARSQTSWQVVDAREDLAAGYEETHVPGAVPMPACDLARTPEAARQHLHRGVPTVIVTASGGQDELQRCLALFTSARALAGGMSAWSDEGLPEDSGTYTPPSARAGGGCL